jgi:hypothetical protein
MKTFALLLMTMTIGIHARVLEDAPAPAPSAAAAAALYGYASDMVLQEGSVDDAPSNITPPNNRGLLQLSNDHKTNDHIISEPCPPNYRFFKGEIYRRKGNVYVFYSPHNEEQVGKVTKDDVAVKYSTHGKLRYKDAPEKINDLRTGDTVQVMASTPCKTRKGYGLYRIFINAPSHSPVVSGV